MNSCTILIGAVGAVVGVVLCVIIDNLICNYNKSEIRTPRSDQDIQEY